MLFLNVSKDDECIWLDSDYYYEDYEEECGEKLELIKVDEDGRSFKKDSCVDLKEVWKELIGGNLGIDEIELMDIKKELRGRKFSEIVVGEGKEMICIEFIE